MNVDGGCFCGHVTYKAVIDPDRVVVCHCTDCQRHAATAYGVVAVVVDDQFEVTKGSLKTFEKTADSGKKRELSFCPECGTRIYAKPGPGETGLFGLRTGSINQRDELTPKLQVWTRSAQPWTADLTGIPGLETQSGLRANK